MLKKDSKFTATVRFLIGGKLNVHMSSPLVYATIVSEEQARAIVETKDLVNVVDSGDLLNNTSQLEFLSTGQLMTTFRNMVRKMTPCILNVKFVVCKNFEIIFYRH